jgi:NYN domain
VHPLALGQLIAADSPYDRRLRQVRVYRGQPDSTRDPRGYAANARQVATWRQSPLVDVTMRTLRYPRGWPDSHQAGQKPQEKGIDVALAIDFVSMAVAGEFEVGVLMSTDTDLKPALETVARLTPTQSIRAEVAAWSSPVGYSRRLSISSRSLYCHWLGKDAYDQIIDATSYS